MSIKKMTKGEWWKLNVFSITILFAVMVMFIYEATMKKDMNIILYLIVFCLIETLLEKFVKNVLKESVFVTDTKRYYSNVFKFFFIAFLINIVLAIFGLYLISYVQLWIIYGLVVFYFEIKADKNNEYL